MRSVETSLVVRYLVQDTPAQAKLAGQILHEGAFIPLTVLLETAWVLGSHYQQTREQISKALFALVEMPSVVITHEAAVRWVIERYSAKGDIADLLHIVAAIETDSILTFDRRMARHSAPDSPVPVILLTA